ncbi:MAG: inorganic pyrophosphatase, partial [Myxococcales bacterium]|nr:inorganic pyrophosphatase [Myxococcales bacterium]
RVDRPQRFSSACPTLYGFIPRTYCGAATARLCMDATGLCDVVGDGDPLDVCVLSEKAFSHGDFLLRCIAVGGLRMIDGGEADDKIVAVLEGDAVYGSVRELSDLPAVIIDRLRHYFLTYKQIPGEQAAKVAIADVYGRAAALDVVRAAYDDYGVLTAA